MSKSLKAKILLVIAAVLWGSGFVAVQAALNVGWSPFSLLFIRGSIAGTILLLLSKREKYAWYKNKKLLLNCFMGGVVMWLGFAFQTYGQDFANVSIASILTSLYVLITPFFAAIFKKQTLTIKVLLASVIAFLAVVLITYSGFEVDFGLGELLLVCCAVFYALHFILVENLGTYKAALAISGVQLLVMGLCSLLMMLITGQSLQTQGLTSALYLAIVCSGAAFTMQVYAQQFLPSSVASVILSFESVFGVIGAILLFKEPLNWQVIVSCLMMVGAVWLLEGRSKENKSS